MSIIEKAINRLDHGKAVAPDTVQLEPKHLAEPEKEPTPAVTTTTIPEAAAPSQVHFLGGKRTSRMIEIDLAQLHQLGMVTPDAERSVIAEEFRRIKRPLIEKTFNANAAALKHGNLIMVASSLPGEGKTFCAVNLAISIAMELDHTVLLVDADVARPSVPRYLSVVQNQDASTIGLMDVLLDDKLDLADAMLRTNIDTLTILRAGRSHKRATELLASQAMSRLLDEISSRYPERIVIFDSPPLLLSTEARVLASQMGQIVLVVEAESTTQYAVKEVLRQLQSQKNITLLFNKVKAFAGEEYYGSYYG
ncbi:XrtA-associated tyrosine autokinase [Solimicrobium silvestre]|uniref:non-specific protein-tyrosine kinase n=1 Tax=Solimicrobium silvestre TaxID=2099400 RepID=A0A2S9H0M2_9BURK|nr:XrtA-associated tyrosine autokinase [Solimicrobium silvestre]PRC93529.1 Exopolysaccharide/PEP-CTERM locus tyrosine autokinase [Solimicrobium silvestre]